MTNQSTPTKQGVTLVDVDIPFSRMVTILVKIAFAAIPAAIVVTLVVRFVAMIMIGLFGVMAG